MRKSRFMVIGAACLVITALLGTLTVTILLNPEDAREITGIVAQAAVFCLLGMLLNPMLASTGGLLKRRREQALLILLPGVPRGRDLNRMVAVRQMAQYGAHWVLGVGLALALQSLAEHIGILEAETPRLVGDFAFSYAAVILPVGVF